MWAIDGSVAPNTDLQLYNCSLAGSIPRWSFRCPACTAKPLLPSTVGRQLQLECMHRAVPHTAGSLLAAIYADQPMVQENLAEPGGCRTQGSAQLSLALQPGNDNLCGPLPSHGKAVNVTSRLATQTIALQSCECTPLTLMAMSRSPCHHGRA